MNAIRVLLVDDKESVRRGLRMRLELEPDLVVIGEAEDGIEAVSAASRLQPDIVLMDLAMPRMGGLEATDAIRQGSAGRPVIVLTIYDNAALRRAAFSAGASGFVAKQESCDALLAAIRAVAKSTEVERERHA